MTHFKKRYLASTLFAVTFLLLILGPAFIKVQALDIQKTPNLSYLQTESFALLSPNFGVKIPDAIGGPIYENEDNEILVANMPMLSEDVSSKKIEDTNGISFYIVQKDDTLSEIAELFDVSENTIKWENNLGNSLKVGTELRILPVAGVTHTIKKGEKIESIAKKYDAEAQHIIIFNNLDEKILEVGKQLVIPNGVIIPEVVVEKVEKNKQEKSKSKKSDKKEKSKTISQASATAGYYARPTSGHFNSEFGVRVHPITGRKTTHFGIDFSGGVGTPIVAAASGTVITNYYCGNGYGICVEIQHDNGTKTRYAHTSKVYVSAGEKVVQGEKIADIGKTGNVTGAHLHFEIIKLNGSRLNPNNLF